MSAKVIIFVVIIVNILWKELYWCHKEGVAHSSRQVVISRHKLDLRLYFKSFQMTLH